MSFAQLGLGTMRFPLTDPSVANSVDLAASCQLVDRALENGISYFDTSWIYCGGASEETLREVLVKRHDASEYTIATKLPFKYLSGRDEAEETFSKQFERLGVAKFDRYLLHNFDRAAAAKAAAVDFDLPTWILSKKEAGLVDEIGFSYHDGPEFLDEVLTKYPFFDFVQLQINYLDWEDETAICSRANYEVARKHGIEIVVMEPIKGGTLAVLPDEGMDALAELCPGVAPAALALRFVASLPGVSVVLSGMFGTDTLDANLATFEAAEPLGEREHEAIKRAVAALRAENAIGCTACKYCAPVCPRQIDIAQCFALYNQRMREKEFRRFSPQGLMFANLRTASKSADDCIACGACEAQCPQHLPIRDLLAKVSDLFK